MAEPTNNGLESIPIVQLLSLISKHFQRAHRGMSLMLTFSAIAICILLIWLVSGSSKLGAEESHAIANFCSQNYGEIRETYNSIPDSPTGDPNYPTYFSGTMPECNSTVIRSWLSVRCTSPVLKFKDHSVNCVAAKQEIGLLLHKHMARVNSTPMKDNITLPLTGTVLPFSDFAIVFPFLLVFVGWMTIISMKQAERILFEIAASSTEHDKFMDLVICEYPEMLSLLGGRSRLFLGFVFFMSPSLLLFALFLQEVGNLFVFSQGQVVESNFSLMMNSSFHEIAISVVRLFLLLLNAVMMNRVGIGIAGAVLDINILAVCIRIRPVLIKLVGNLIQDEGILPGLIRVFITRRKRSVKSDGYLHFSITIELGDTTYETRLWAPAAIAFREVIPWSESELMARLKAEVEFFRKLKDQIAKIVTESKEHVIRPTEQEILHEHISPWAPLDWNCDQCADGSRRLAPCLFSSSVRCRQSNS